MRTKIWLSLSILFLTVLFTKLAVAEHHKILIECNGPSLIKMEEFDRLGKCMYAVTASISERPHEKNEQRFQFQNDSYLFKKVIRIVWHADRVKIYLAALYTYELPWRFDSERWKDDLPPSSQNKIHNYKIHNFWIKN